ncbi:AraC family transcriptional regulator [Shimia sp. R9_3]|uniref:AraC family transcriptional regulator n=1 Tax=Shimia sp. R9_3 TaxID=2821113 RepID=UPI001ADB1B0F|nr:AraC family transcriptional regulator [Shimia sp. R9_3]MBO9402584.1 AraC family transcriptional regulator [Shimia sp. R9_3]
MFETDAFSEVLDIVHVRGESARVITPETPLAFAVPPGKPCVYILQQGALDITPAGGATVTLQEKQIALMLQGTAHDVVFRDPALKARQATLIDPESGDRLRPAIHCFCGSFTVDGDLAERVLQSLPQVIVLDGLAEDPIEWLDEMCGLVLRELGATQPGASPMVSRLLDLLLVVILRRWAQSDDSLPGWLAAAKDERIARAIAAIHSNSGGSLSNAELADIAGMSVSNFADRFKQVMGQGPGAYLRGWRLDQAAEALLHSSASIEAIADRVGYASKEAFSRAFQAKFGQSPSAWRGARHA